LARPGVAPPLQMSALVRITDVTDVDDDDDDDDYNDDSVGFLYDGFMA